MRTKSLLWVAVLAGCQSPPPATEEVPTYYDIGVVHRAVTTSSPEAQLWFDRGLALTYGFNHEEAIRCFERAAELDPACAMAFWGKAYALGPNYNNTEMTPEACRDAYGAMKQAEAVANGCSPVEQDLIAALSARYPSPDVAPRPPIEAAYAEVMRGVLRTHADNSDVAALTAEALMMLRPWKLWSPDGEPAPELAEIRSVLEAALARWPDHPALCHLYIHAMEAGPKAENALPAAARLETLTPGLGHLVHMPSHIYIWTGRYQDAVRVNQVAVELDRAYVDHAGRHNFYTLYRLHNYHFVAYGAMWSGQREVALAAARELVTEIPPDLLVEMADFLDIFVATPLHVMVRFGMWEEILAEPEPAAELVATRAVWHYARGIALASLGRVEEAVVEQQAFAAARSAVPESRVLFNNPVAQILAVADAVLAGEIEYRRGNHDRAFALLRNAVELDLLLNYDEPWGWMEPARHALGALLTEQGKYAEAEAVYLANLARYPENGWALHGLAECMEKTERPDEAAAVRKRFEVAFAAADTEIPGSCFCKTQ